MENLLSRTHGWSSGPVKRASLVAALLLVVAACGSPSTTTPTPSTQADLFNPTTFNTSNVPWLAANNNATGTPVRGGTLLLEGSTDLSAAADPQGEYETIAFTLERAYTRQLVSYAASTDLTMAETLVPDAATSMPTVSSDGLTYTFTLRPGLMWNTTPPRPVTSQDFQRGILRECDPTLAPNANPGYASATIVGFQAFCTPFETSSPAEGAAARAAFINKGMTSVSGIKTPDANTIVFTLTKPATDFNNILALPFFSAAPVEYLGYVPLTPGNKLYSDGPYQISTYNVGHEIILTRNPEWSQGTDPIRHDYVNEIDVKLDLAGAAATTEVQQDMQAGTADLAWNTVVPTADIAGLQSPWNPDFGLFPTPGTTNPYLVFNVKSPNNNGAMANVKVRQALEYAIDKVAMGKIYGGPSINQPLNQVIGPGAEGYVPFNDYPTTNNQGDPGKCKSLLAAAGYPNGLTLKDYYRNSGNHPAIYQEVQSDFAKCGVTVVGIPIATGYYGSTGIGVTPTKSGYTPGKWDITEPGWVPDWFGPTNGRATLPDLFDGATQYPGTDWGGYDNPAVDSLINQAETATTVAAAASLWHQADEQIMSDAAFIPFQTQLYALFHSTRVHNAIFIPFTEQYDITQIWLSS